MGELIHTLDHSIVVLDDRHSGRGDSAYPWFEQQSGGNLTMRERPHRKRVHAVQPPMQSDAASHNGSALTPPSSAPATRLDVGAIDVFPSTDVMKAGAEPDALERSAESAGDSAVRVREIDSQPAMLRPLLKAPSSPVRDAHAASANSPSSGGFQISRSLRDRLEPRFGFDFSAVRIHDDADSHRSAENSGARAFTTGQRIAFGRNEYAPSTESGAGLIAHELAHVVQQSQSPSAPPLQRAPASGTKAPNPPSSGELAWEVFSPIAFDAIRSLAPHALTSTRVGQHYKEVIEVVDKLEDSASKLADYSQKIKEVQTSTGSEERKFALQSLKKVNDHFRSVPNAVNIDGDALINEAAQIVTSDMFTDMASAVDRLTKFEEIVDRTKRLRSPYQRMIQRLSAAETRAQVSFDALGVLETELLNLIPVAVLPAYQAWLFSTSQKVGSYRSDAGRILSTIRGKREGYEKSMAASEAMEKYMSGAAGRKANEESYRDPKDPACLGRVAAGLSAVKGDSEEIYDHVLTYSECTFESVLDALDFLPIEDSDGFFAMTEGLRDAYPNRTSEIDAKETRYQAGLTLYATLQQVRPSLLMIDVLLNPLVMKFITQEYYLFWTDDSRSLLSNTRFTYTHQIEQMTVNASLLPLAALAGHYFQSR